MRIGIIAEGRGDLAVISNILRGRLGIESEHIQFLRPEYNLDETDLHTLSEEQHSNWEVVKQECVDCTRLQDFLESPLDEERLVVIHIDTDQVEHPNFGVKRPQGKGEEYVLRLRQLVASKLKEWLAGRGAKRTRYAIAVEETDAWVLTLYSAKDTSALPNAKERLKRELNRRYPEATRKRLFLYTTFDHYDELSRDFRKDKKLRECATRNHSLRLFLESL